MSPWESGVKVTASSCGVFLEPVRLSQEARAGPQWSPGGEEGRPKQLPLGKHPNPDNPSHGGPHPPCPPPRAGGTQSARWVSEVAPCSHPRQPRQLGLASFRVRHFLCFGANTQYRDCTCPNAPAANQRNMNMKWINSLTSRRPGLAASEFAIKLVLKF